MLGILAGTFFTTLPCQADLQQQDESIRKFIQATAAGNNAQACKELGWDPQDATQAAFVQNGIETLGGKKVDDITRTSFQYHWVNGVEMLHATYHIRAGDAGFYLYYSSKKGGPEPPSVDFSFEKTEANPWEVRAINFSKEHWGALLSALFVAMILFVVLLIWAIMHFANIKPGPPKIPVP